ncbi:hypothetical protein QVD99_005715 [Batrachochytrium dendrobatidis]|nr:hypothetical protein QVD99_005715 [Batrachochytrium dendrobatidis]
MNCSGSETVVMLSDQHQITLVEPMHSKDASEHYIMHINGNSCYGTSGSNSSLVLVSANSIHFNNQTSESAMKSIAPSTSVMHSTLPFGFIQCVLAELSEIGFSRITDMDGLFQHISIQISDRAGRPHILMIHITPAYPLEPPTCHSDLPMELDPSKIKSIKDAVELHEQAINQYNSLWSELEDLDQQAWIIEKTTTTRRIAVGMHCTMTIELNALSPRSAPLAMSFLGPDQAVVELDRKVASIKTEWDCHASVVVNLERLLGMVLPRQNTPHVLNPSGGVDQTTTFECGICLSFHLENDTDQRSIPSFHCPNTNCGQAFHRECITEWLRSVPDTRQGLYLLIGPCPFCDTPLPIESLAIQR